MGKHLNPSIAASMFASLIFLGSLVLPHVIVLISYLLSEYFIKRLIGMGFPVWILEPEYYILFDYQVFPYISYVILGLLYVLYVLYVVSLIAISFIGYMVYRYALLIFMGMVSLATISAYTVTRQMIKLNQEENLKDN